MRRRTIILAQTRTQALDWMHNHDIDRNGKDVHVVIGGQFTLSQLRGLDGFDYVTLPNWDVFVTPAERKAVWENLAVVDARQLSPESLAPIS